MSDVLKVASRVATDIALRLEGGLLVVIRGITHTTDETMVTSDVPADPFRKWMKDNQDLEFVRAGLVKEHDENEDVREGPEHETDSSVSHMVPQGSTSVVSAQASAAGETESKVSAKVDEAEQKAQTKVDAAADKIEKALKKEEK